MSLSDIDTTRDLRTPDELRSLVEAIFNSPPNAQETNWLEWKSSLDLGTAEGRFTVAKAILGFANRSVEQAHLKCAGVAYMVVGVEPGEALGVTPVDHATLGQRIKTYADGPRWTPHYVPFSGVEVLVIVVEPPRPGDPAHALQKAFSNNKSGYYEGTVFHRGTAHTEPAGKREIQMLGERLLHGARQPDLDLVLRAAAEPLTRLNAGREQVDDWLARHERYVRSNSGAPPPPPPPPPQEPKTPFERFAGMSGLSSSIGTAFMAGMYASPKDREEYNRRVKNYVAKVRRGLFGNIVKSIVRSDYKNKVYCAVGNLTDDPVAGVQFTVIIPRSKLLVFTSPPPVDQLPPLPKWPDEIRDRMTNVPLSALPQDYDFDPHGGLVTETTEAFEVTWDIGDLRPGEWSQALEFTVVPHPDAPDEVEITMAAGAMNRRRRVTETATLLISTDAWTPDDFYVAEPDE
ncbi:hypothetical protein ACKUUI_02350 [Mycobacterium seoulense]|uniref:AlbA family DNA-binding domain-containing protein n=1 Tax=Mycobacterium seoulense TaxID=386911 RepID=UPI003CEFD7AF